MQKDHTFTESTEQKANDAAQLSITNLNVYDSETTPTKHQQFDATDASVASEVYEDDFKAARQVQAKKDMIYGALWCVGGLGLTLADVGFIFWGAILFGGIQFFKGLANWK